jgi:predicted lactoylglutathione lyase
LFYRYISATSASGVVTLTAKEAGVPFTVNIFKTMNWEGSYTYSNKTANVSSMSIPSETASNEVVYKAIEKGGKYTSVLTVVSGCDYNVDENDFFSWCYDIDNFECCFVSLLSKKECCKNSKNVYDDAAIIQNVIKAISVMKKNNYEEAEIQQVVNLGHTICEPLKCNCGC